MVSNINLERHKTGYVISDKSGFILLTSWLHTATKSINPYLEWKNRDAYVMLTIVFYHSDEKLNVENFAVKTYQFKPVAHMRKKM